MANPRGREGGSEKVNLDERGLEVFYDLGGDDAGMGPIGYDMGR